MRSKDSSSTQNSWFPSSLTIHLRRMNEARLAVITICHKSINSSLASAPSLLSLFTRLKQQVWEIRIVKIMLWLFLLRIMVRGSWHLLDEILWSETVWRATLISGNLIRTLGLLIKSKSMRQQLQQAIQARLKKDRSLQDLWRVSILKTWSPRKQSPPQSKRNSGISSTSCRSTPSVSCRSTVTLEGLNTSLSHSSRTFLQPLICSKQSKRISLLTRLNSHLLSLVKAPKTSSSTKPEKAHRSGRDKPLLKCTVQRKTPFQPHWTSRPSIISTTNLTMTLSGNSSIHLPRSSPKVHQVL